MEEFGGLFVLIFLYLFIALPIRLAKKAGGKNSASRGKATARLTKSFPAEAFSTEVAPSEMGKSETAMAVETIGQGETVSGKETRPIYEERKPFGGSEELYRGSLDAQTGEGEDPCHEEQMESLRPETSPMTETPTGGLQLSWTGNEIVRGFVMSEVLKRRGA